MVEVVLWGIIFQIALSGWLIHRKLNYIERRLTSMQFEASMWFKRASGPGWLEKEINDSTKQ